jgi:hypothetical protein
MITFFRMKQFFQALIFSNLTTLLQTMLNFKWKGQKRQAGTNGKIFGYKKSESSHHIINDDILLYILFILCLLPPKKLSLLCLLWQEKMRT